MVGGGEFYEHFHHICLMDMFVLQRPILLPQALSNSALAPGGGSLPAFRAVHPVKSTGPPPRSNPDPPEVKSPPPLPDPPYLTPPSGFERFATREEGGGGGGVEACKTDVLWEDSGCRRPSA